ncbi:hypothetical protein SAMN05443377_11037 [Propionibacterium cyclohexanicum]|uniref:NAD(P)-binding domain-containing protein n=1 Tax=Propionibacterium cyclohexanicum TaxID=64702 RepID=A0A1H9RY62_9ACTN|nr:NAD(P)H-binding protein [Propionibacterium cyclohexanicum]SER77746.1 hypothetical protein SAMN05443377_11037 [Propionibacterium cyclohexanicum]
MKIVVVGATGMVGSRIVAEALHRGHEVVAVTRRGTAVDGATSAKAEFTDTPAILDLAKNADALVVAVPPSRTSPEPIEVNIEAHQRIIDAKPTTRVLVVGGAGSLLEDGVRLVDTPGFPEDYKREGIWGSDLLERYRAAGDSLDWVFVSPSPVIAPGERTGHYTLGTDSPAGEHVSAENFAVGVLDELEKPAHRHQRITFAD